MPFRSPILAPARAPRLRRLAQRLDDQAERSSSPLKARALACKMRLRAAELESGGVLSEAEDQAQALFEVLGGELDEG